MRRASCRSVPSTYNPPASMTPSPSLMSTPRPAMLVAVVELDELLLLRLGGTGHAGELLVQAEVVLERDRRERDVLLLDLHPLLRLDRLVEALGPAPAFHDPAGELVDDLHLAVLDHV